MSTARRPPSKKKFPDLSIAFPKESLASWASLISSPGCLVFSRIFFASMSSSFSPKYTVENLTLLPGCTTFVFSRSWALIIALGAKAKELEALSGSERIEWLTMKSASPMLTVWPTSSFNISINRISNQT